MQNGKGWAVRKRCFLKIVIDERQKKGCREKSEYMPSNRSEGNLFNGMAKEFVTSFLISLSICF